MFAAVSGAGWSEASEERMLRLGKELKPRSVRSSLILLIDVGVAHPVNLPRRYVPEEVEIWIDSLASKRLIGSERRQSEGVERRCEAALDRQLLQRV